MNTKLSISKLLPFIIFVIFIFTMIHAIYNFRKSLDSSPMIGKDLPEIQLKDLFDDSQMISDKTFPKEYILLNIFGSWCVACKIEHPFLMKLKEEGVKIYGINWRDEESVAKEFLGKYGNPYERVGVDKEGKVIIDLGVIGAAETYLIDGNGKIITKYMGVLNETIYQEYFKSYIKN